MKKIISLLLGVTTASALSASTTRYWDCSGGACGCAYDKGRPWLPIHCHSNALFKAPAGNKYGAALYGGAALSQALGGGNWMAEGCGKCFKVTGTANVGGQTKTTTLVLKGTNYCPPENEVCGPGKAHFDIAAPGFDWAGASLSNTCAEVGEEPGLHNPQVCANWMINSDNPDENCDCHGLKDEALRNGCLNFQNLYWDNPVVEYEALDSCPDELVKHAPCWDDNGGKYPFDAPATCANPPDIKETWECEIPDDEDKKDDKDKKDVKDKDNEDSDDEDEDREAVKLQKAAEELQKAAEELQKAAEQRQRAAEERQRDAEKHQREAEQRQRDAEKHLKEAEERLKEEDGERKKEADTFY